MTRIVVTKVQFSDISEVSLNVNIKYIVTVALKSCLLISMSQKIKVELFYDIVSPYSWLAFEVLCRYRQSWNLNLEFRPMFLGAVMKASNNTPPGINPVKAKYMSIDIQRNRQLFAVPLVPPADFLSLMTSTLEPMRMLAAVCLAYPQSSDPHNRIEKLSRAMWLRVWSYQQDLSKDSILAAFKEIGINNQQEMESLLEKSRSVEAKQELIKNTNRAIAAGAFGAPIIIAHHQGQEQIFFGSDRFEQMAFVLGRKWNGPNPDNIVLPPFSNDTNASNAMPPSSGKSKL